MRRSALLLVLAGCGGVKPDTRLNDLEVEDWAELCADMTAAQVDQTKDCGGFTADIPAYTAADCEADVSFLSAGCDAVVGDWQTCMTGYLASDICNPQYPSACELIAPCDSLR